MQPGPLDISAILAAVYRVPVKQTDEIASRVRSRLALLETVGECARLLFEAPMFALRTSLERATTTNVTDAAR